MLKKKAKELKMPYEYIVPEAILNVAYGNNGDYGPMPCRDEIFPIPDHWLEANAKRFFVTDQQILDAAVTKFETPNLPKHSRCFLVYFLIGNKEIIYVGQSSNFDLRLDTHKKNGVPFDSFAWMEVPKLYISDIEAYYIDRIDPIYNNKFPIAHSFGDIAKTFEGPGERQPRKERVIVIDSQNTLPWG